MPFIWQAVMVFLVKSKLGEVLWRELVELVQRAEMENPEHKRDWVLAQLTTENIAQWLLNLALEVAVGLLQPKK